MDVEDFQRRIVKALAAGVGSFKYRQWQTFVADEAQLPKVARARGDFAAPPFEVLDVWGCHYDQLCRVLG